jgi:hypothetical protein
MATIKYRDKSIEIKRTQAKKENRYMKKKVQ